MRASDRAAGALRSLSRERPSESVERALERAAERRRRREGSADSDGEHELSQYEALDALNQGADSD